MSGLRTSARLAVRPFLLVSLMLLVTAGLTMPAIAQDTDASKADTIAQRMVEAHGIEAWETLPYLRFDFAVEGGGQTQLVARNLWNRQTGAYRIELPDTAQTVMIVQTNASSPGNVTGTVYQGGEEVSGEEKASLLQTGYQRFINDTYWLLAPLKVFDEGVNRSYVADSSQAGHDVIHLTFGDVGLTPDDEYWLYVNKETGLLDRWAFRLQSMADDATPASFDWTGYVTLSAPGGEVRLAERHEGGQRAILTNELRAPTEVPDDAFTSPTPMLGE
ncbi:MAG: hypothetical protein GVY25_01655 [Bacteroidetes bacterium]|nr:hypothetical protein [Bacteroidota bacterium]